MISRFDGMYEQLVEITTPSGAMETFITRPQDGGPFAPVILYMDIWGVREELYDIARKVGTVGYCCLVPDLYHRQGRVRHAFYDDNGRMITLESLSEERKEMVRAPGRELRDDMVVEDTGAMLKMLAQDRSVRPGPVGALGYCMGGRHVFRVAGAYPDRFKANACLHGSDLVIAGDDSPHLSAVKSQGELYCGYAEHDSYATTPIITAIAFESLGLPARGAHRRGAWLRAAGSRRLCQACRQSRLGIDLRDVPPAVGPSLSKGQLAGRSTARSARSRPASSLSEWEANPA
jgi:carboxymethylenebutenolidase